MDWTYSGASLGDGRVAVEMRTAERHEVAPEAEWLDARIVVALPPNPAEPMLRLEALRKLNALISAEIERLEDRLADGVR